MASDYQLPLKLRVAEHMKAGSVYRRWRRWRSFARPLPQDWWSDFERDFRSYTGASRRQPPRIEPDR